MNETESQLQIPNLGIEVIRNDQEILEIPENTFPWIEGKVEVPTALVELETGETIRYGSLVGHHNGIEKIASKVTTEQSESAQRGLFKALPEMLHVGSSMPVTIDFVNNYNGINSSYTVYKVAKQGNNAARLFFAVLDSGSEQPTVLKLGIAPHDKQMALINIMNKTKGGRQKHDG
jgi:hypothetical protein